MWADAETDVDYLNYSEVAELIAELIANPALLPLSLGVFGVGASASRRRSISSSANSIARPINISSSGSMPGSIRISTMRARR